MRGASWVQKNEHKIEVGFLILIMLESLYFHSDRTNITDAIKNAAFFTKSYMYKTCFYKLFAFLNLGARRKMVLVTNVGWKDCEVQH